MAYQLVKRNCEKQKKFIVFKQDSGATVSVGLFYRWSYESLNESMESCCVCESDSFSLWVIILLLCHPPLCMCVTCQKCVSFEAAECWRALSVLSVAGDWGGPGACPLPPVTGSVCGSALHHSATSLAGCATPTHTNTEVLNNGICQLWQSDTSRFSWTQFDDTILILICHRNDTKNSSFITNSSVSITRNQIASYI